MFQFFHGWRRKFGCAALLVACVFTAWWVRSFFTGDYLALAVGGYRIAILSQQGSFSSGVFSRPSNGQPSEAKSGWWTAQLPTAEVKFVHYPAEFPYWFIVVPLWLLSAWLLYGKSLPWMTGPSLIQKLPPIGNKPGSSNRSSRRKSKRSR